ncbi:XAC2610-related protein [Pedobacter sp. NJ-S-72]
MKNLNLLLFFILTWSCSFAQQNISENDSNIVAIDSVRINHKIYKAIFTVNETSSIPYSALYILNSNGLIIFQDSTNNEFSSFKFIDFNGDGYKDLLISYATNVPGIQDLILFNPKNNKFRKVTGFTGFPASQRIKGTNYYYSYHRSGCADMYWDSDLYELKKTTG